MHPCFTSYPASACSRFRSLELATPLSGGLRFELPLNLAWFALGGSERAVSTNALAQGWNCASAPSLLLLRAAACAVASNRANHASGGAVALTQGLQSSVAFGVRWRGSRRSLLQIKPVPNPSVKRRANSKSPGPACGALHSPQPVPGASPSPPAYLER